MVQRFALSPVESQGAFLCALLMVLRQNHKGGSGGRKMGGQMDVY